MSGVIDRIYEKLVVNSSRVHLRRFIERAADHMSEGDTILDAGAGDGKHKKIFKNYSYHSTDIKQIRPFIEKLSFQSDLETIPAADEIYDLIICTQVLEHVPEPSIILDELFRVTKKDGELWLTAPFYFEEHEIPDDYFRFSKYGLRYLIEKAGYSISSIEWLEGYFGTLSYELRKAARMLPINPMKYSSPIIGLFLFIPNLILKPLFLLLSIFFASLDTVIKLDNVGNCKNYSIVAIKGNENQGAR